MRPDERKDIIARTDFKGPTKVEAVVVVVGDPTKGTSRSPGIGPNADGRRTDNARLGTNEPPTTRHAIGDTRTASEGARPRQDARRLEIGQSREYAHGVDLHHEMLVMTSTRTGRRSAPSAVSYIGESAG